MSLEGPSKVDPEEDTIFVAEDEAGTRKAEVVMDSLELLRGSTVDFQVSNCAYFCRHSGSNDLRL
jgi:iron-sulfur cluster assembly 2